MYRKKSLSFAENMTISIKNMIMENLNELKLNDAQQQYLRTLSMIRTPQALDDLNDAIAQYMVKKLDAEIDRLWETGELTDEKTDGFRHLHERTSYQ